MGHEPPHWEVVRKIPPQGGLQADGEETLAIKVQRIDIHPAGGRDGGGRATGGGDLRLPLP